MQKLNVEVLDEVIPSQLIIGAGGNKKSSGNSGGTSGATPTESPNTLRSRSSVVMLFAACEGEIEGFKDQPFTKYVYLDDTPVVNPDGSSNFSNIFIDYRTGTEYQTYIPNIASDVENEINVGVQLRASSGSVNRTISNSDANSFSIRVSVPSLLEQDSSGNIKEASVSFRVDVSSAGSSFVTLMNRTISGKTSGAYEESYRYNLPGAAPWVVRLTRTSPDSNKTTVQTSLFWQSLTEITDVKLRYPNTVLFAVKVSAEQFSNIPKISVLLRLLKILIPTNYNSITRQYSGIFDGTLYSAWSDNPAWVFYDLATNSRYGAGKFIKENLIDVFDLYTIGQYCDELVSNGYGGVEPRFTCNCIIQNQDDAFKVLESIASCFRGMMFERAGQLTAIQDRPRSPTRVYTNANVICEFSDEGEMTSPPFNYSGSSLDTRFTVARVSWSDPNNSYRTTEEVVEDTDAIIKYGYIPTEIVAFGCTSRGQAYRAGKWLLLSQRLLTQVITFKVGAEGLLILPGEVFKVMDTLKSLNKLGGRIKTATTTAITLDASVTLSPGVSYTLTIVKSDGTTETRSVVNTGTTLSILTVASAFSEIPRHLWILESNLLSAQLFRCTAVAEVDDHVYEISGTEYNANIYGTIESSSFTFDDPVISGYPNVNLQPSSPSGLTVVDSLFESIGSGGIRTRVDVFWAASPSPFIDRYQVEYRTSNDSNYLPLATTKELAIIAYDIPPGLYDFRVKVVTRYNISSPYTTTRIIIYGLTAPPADIENFTILYSGSNAIFQWEKSKDLDVNVGGYLKIKYSSRISGVTWTEGVEVAKLSGVATSYQTFVNNGTYLIKAVDSSGHQSTNAKIIVVNGLPDLSNKNIVYTTNRHPVFSGIRTNVIVSGGILKISSLDYFDVQAGLFDSFPGLFDSVAGYLDSYIGLFDNSEGLFDDAGLLFAVFPEGSYEIAAPIDLLNVYPVRISINIFGYSANELINFDRTGGNFDSLTGSFDGQDNDNSTCAVYVSISQDAVIYNEYQPFIVSEYVGRAFKFKVVLKSTEANHNYFLERFGITIDMPDRVIAGNVTSNMSANTTVLFDKSFAATPEVAATLLNSSPGDYVELVSRSNSRFVFACKNSAGTRIVRAISYLAKGYGEIN
jgi:predicted phage tail protein